MPGKPHKKKGHFRKMWLKYDILGFYYSIITKHYE